MPASSPDQTTMPELHFEAPTAEDALAAVAERLGNNAEIVSVEKALRGGIGGFFAREVVQITARPRDPAQPHGAPDIHRVLADLATQNDADQRSFAETLRAQLQPSAGSIRPPDAPAEVIRAVTSIDAPIEAPKRQAQDRSRPEPTSHSAPTSRTVQQPTAPAPSAAAQVEPEAPDAPVTVDDDIPPVRAVAPAPLPPLPPAAPQPPAAAPPATVVAPAAAVTAPAVAQSGSRGHTDVPAVAGLGPSAIPGMPDWSQDNLRRLGLPPLVVDAVAGLDARDDLAWVHAIGMAVATLCRPLPAGDAVLAGPRATKFAGPWKLQTVRPGGQPPRRGSFVAPVRDTEQGRSWLAWAKGSRWMHLVVGGDRWRDLLFDEPLAVSWVGSEALPEAITLSANLGLVLGWGTDGKDVEPRRANPVDVAVAIRAMVPRR